MGVSNKAWLQLLKSYGMNHSACMKLTRDICRTTNKYRIELHNVRFRPEKARRAAEKVKNREALGDYIRKWYSTLSHERVEFSQCSLGKCGAKTSGSEHTKIKHAKLLNKHKWFVH